MRDRKDAHKSGSSLAATYSDKDVSLATCNDRIFLQNFYLYRKKVFTLSLSFSLNKNSDLGKSRAACIVDDTGKLPDVSSNDT